MTLVMSGDSTSNVLVTELDGSVFDRLLLSEDICMLNHLKYAGGKGFGYLLEVFVPLLKERDITDDQIHQMLVENPARVFSRACRA
ncbi:MAG: hypothetical protein DWQ45_18945 [Planctomycetota bacterium]|nr:MAG: hypothetical protein DWQ41_11740 [Planctomycetota bacterium]REK31689.1 MAG: hypothetical protein DWQ45_18945 [Planctomycetota bacterium]